MKYLNALVLLSLLINVGCQSVKNGALIGTAVLFAAAEATYDNDNPLVHKGRIKKIVKNESTYTVTFEDGEVHEIPRKDGIFRSGDFIEVRKRDGKDIFARHYSPDSTLEHEGTIDRIHVKSESMDLHFEDGMSYEVDLNPKIKSGMKVKIIRTDKELRAEKK